MAALSRDMALTPALTQEPEPAPAPAQVQDSGGAGCMDVLALLRLRDRMKEQFQEYNTAVLGGQENCFDPVIEEKFIESATQGLQRDVDEVKVSFQNKALALQRIQIMDALRNKMYEGDEDSRLIVETVKHIVLLSRTIIEYQQQALQKEQQLIDVKRKRLSLKKDGEKLQRIQSMKKRKKEDQESLNDTETERMLDKLEGERQMTTIIQNMFQSILIGSRVNWAEDPTLKAIVLQLEKNVYLQ